MFEGKEFVSNKFSKGDADDLLADFVIDGKWELRLPVRDVTWSAVHKKVTCPASVHKKVPCPAPSLVSTGWKLVTVQGHRKSTCLVVKKGNERKQVLHVKVSDVRVDSTPSDVADIIIGKLKAEFPWIESGERDNLEDCLEALRGRARALRQECN